MTTKQFNCRHKIISMFKDRTICIMCKADLKYNKETGKEEVVSKPKEQTFADKLADGLQKKIVQEVTPLMNKESGND